MSDVKKASAKINSEKNSTKHLIDIFDGKKKKTKKIIGVYKSTETASLN